MSNDPIDNLEQMTEFNKRLGYSGPERKDQI